MAAISQAMTLSLLNWSLNIGTAPTRPVGTFCGLSTTALPTSVASSEVGTASGYVRATMTFSASTPSGSGQATNVASVTFGTFNAVGTVSGAFIADTVSSNAGTGLYFGSLSNARTVSSGDTLVFASAALTITLS